jgi:molecular chaperone DnaK (HSP70)
MASIGIDLGTSNTVLAFVGKDGHAEVRRVRDHELVPSVVHVEGIAGRRSVGRDALLEWADQQSNPAETFRRWKLAMGDRHVLATQNWGAGEVEITPELLTTWLVEYLVNDFTTGVGGEPITSVVVTVPHGWRREDSAKCAATRVAAARALIDGTPIPVQARTVDEPVAAAAYALYEAHNRGEFVGRTVLVVDIGGGTCDLSLIEVGKVDQPFVVVDAVNNNVGGDFATALLFVEALGTLAAAAGEILPTDPAALLDLVRSGSPPWLRRAFVDAEEQQLVPLSEQVTRLEKRDNYRNRLSTYNSDVKTITIGPVGSRVDSRISPPELVERLQPFYEQLRALLHSFLKRQDTRRLPYAILLTGGGSRIGGLRKEAIEPVIQEFLGDDASSALGRISLNDTKLATAVALGAALIADGKVSIEERLLCDVGLIIRIPPDFSKALRLGEGDEWCIVSPMLKRGATLPVRVSSTSLGFGCMDVDASTDKQFEQKIVVFDDLTSPYVQTWTDDHPAGGRYLAGVTVDLWADTEGALGLVVTNKDGSRVVDHPGTLNRPVRMDGSGALTLPGREDMVALPPVRSPEQIAQAISKRKS